MNSKITNDFKTYVKDNKLNIYGIKVWQDGRSVKEVFEEDGYPHNIYSATKTFTSLAISICEDKGLIDLNDPWIKYFPELEDLAAKETEEQKITNLLHMTGGKRDIQNRFALEGDIVTEWAKMPVVHEPGTFFEYINCCSITLGRLIEKVTGKNLRTFLDEEILSKLDIRNYQWFTDRNNHPFGHSAMFMFLDDFSKQGELLVNEGIYKGQRIVSREYIKAMYTDVVKTRVNPKDKSQWSNGYGRQVWLCSKEGCYRADGLHGQYNIIIPQKNAYITIQSNEAQEKCEDILNKAFELIVEEL